MMTNREKQEAFKGRMYAAGYKQKTVWVLRYPEEGKKLTRAVFLRRFDKLTAGWSAGSLSELFHAILNMVKGAKEVRKDT
jgi:hypothetical protein